MKSLLLVLFLLVTNSAWANYERIHIAILPNSKVVDYYKKAIINAYSGIGRAVVLHEMPAGRSLPLSNLGRVDAEMVRTSFIEEYAKNLIRIPVVLGEGKLVLYCALSALCNLDALDNKENIVGVMSGTNITTIYMENKKAKLMAFSSGNEVAEKLKAGVIRYALSIDINNQGNYAGLSHQNFKTQALVNLQAFHYIHRKHRKLVPALTIHLRKAIARLTQH